MSVLLFSSYRRWLVVAVVAVVVVALCWWVTIVMAMDFSHELRGLSAGSAGSVGLATSWQSASFLALFAMWAIMMVAMMSPSFLPTVVLYARLLDKQAVRFEQSAQGCSASFARYRLLAFVGGYVVAWLSFSVAVSVLHQQAVAAAVLSESLVLDSAWLRGGVLIGAGIFQLTPMKRVCLKACRHPAFFFVLHWRGGVRGAFRMGLTNGGFCLGCCWCLMLLLFVGGIMDLRWILFLTVWVLLEKVLPVSPEWLARGSAVLFVGLGIAEVAVF